MNKLFLVIAMLCQFAYGANYYEVDASVNNIPTTFSVVSTGSVLGVCAKGPHAVIINDTSGDIIWGLGKNASVVPVADGGPVPDATSANLYGIVDLNGTESFFIRSKTGSAITSGNVYVQCGKVKYND